MRDDVRELDTTGKNQDIVDTTIVSQIGFEKIERVPKVGQLQAATITFDESWIVTWPDAVPSKSGVIVSIQRSGDVATIEDVDCCIEYLDDHIVPQIA